MVNYDVLKESLPEAMKDKGYMKDGDYNTHHVLDVMIAMFAAIMLASKGGESVENAAERLEISVVSHNLGDDFIKKALKATDKKPRYAIIFDDKASHFSTFIVDKNDAGQSVVTAFDGMGEGRFEAKDTIQQRVKSLLPRDAIFNDRSQKVQVDQCCGLTAACVIADYEKNRGQYLKDQNYVSADPLLTPRGLEEQRKGYKELGKKVFAAIELAIDEKEKPMHEALVQKQIADDEAFALQLAAEEAGMNVANIEKIRESQRARWEELVKTKGGDNSRGM